MNRTSLVKTATLMLLALCSLTAAADRQAIHPNAMTPPTSQPNPPIRKDEPAARSQTDDKSLDRVLAEVVQGVCTRYVKRLTDKPLRPEDVAVTATDLTQLTRVRIGNFRGEEPIYPASVVKLFYLVAAHRWLEDGRLTKTDELDRTLRAMIVDSSNDATAALVDALAGVGNGAPLPEDEMRQWADRRQAVNRYFASLGYQGINVCQKTYEEGPFGRDRIFVGPNYENGNRLTTNATARLLAEIVRGQAVSPQRSSEMLALLKRDPTHAADDPDDQATQYTARALPPGTRLWSKAGWTSTARHDAAYVELPDGRKLVLVVFTTGHAQDREILPELARGMIAALNR